jgi:hypothetical protein
LLLAGTDDTEQRHDPFGHGRIRSTAEREISGEGDNTKRLSPPEGRQAAADLLAAISQPTASSTMLGKWLPHTRPS